MTKKNKINYLRIKHNIYALNLEINDLREMIKYTDKEVNNFKKTVIESIVEVVSDYYETSSEKIYSKSRSIGHSGPRQVAMYLIKKNLPTLTLKNIGDHFLRNHATVLHAVKTVKNLIEVDRKFKEQITKLEELIYNE